jgi:hypothetical protein
MASGRHDYPKAKDLVRGGLADPNLSTSSELASVQMSGVF